MAHVHGAGKIAEMSKLVADGAGKAVGQQGMEGMAEMMKRGIADAAPVSFHNVAKGAAVTGAVVSAGSSAGRSFMGRIFKHPLVLFGLGVALGFTVHKYRKEIIDAANRASEKGKDFVLQQKENLEDLVAGTRESKD